MSTRRVAGTLTALAMVLFGSFVNAQNQALTALQKVAQSLSPLSSDPIVFFFPGRIINPALDPSSIADEQELLTIYDKMVKPSLIYVDASASLGTLYLSILKDNEWATVPLLPIQRDQLKALGHTLYQDDGTTPSPGYKTFLQLRTAYQAAQKAVDDSDPDQVSPGLKQQLIAAQRDLDMRGHRLLYEGAEAQYRALQEQTSYSWRDSDLRSALQSQIDLNGVKALPSTTSPSRDSDLSWTHISMSNDPPNASQDGSVPFSSSTQHPAAWWQFQGQGTPTDACSPSDFGADTTVSFDVTLLPIVRSWYDPSIWKSQSWRNPGDTRLVSDGLLDANTGIAPAVPNSIIIVKNLMISGARAVACIPVIRRTLRSHQSVAFGPFVIAGNSFGPDLIYEVPTLSKTTISVSAPQVVGMAVTVLPKAPNPNPAYLWPNH